VKLPNVSGKDAVKALIKDGFVRKFHHPIGKTTIVIPNHKELKKGTLARILKQAKITPDKFRQLLGK